MSEISQPLQLKKFTHKKANSEYGGLLPASPLANKKKISSKRKYLAFQLKLVKKELFPNDILIQCLFQTIRKFKPGIKRVSIWLPVNIREKFNQGFGNGLGRARIHDCFLPTTKESLLNIKKQKRAALKNGELFSIPFYKKLNFIEKIFTKLYLRRPFINYASTILSHIDDSKNSTGMGHYFTKINGIANLHQKHSLSLSIHTSNCHDITITYDEEQHSTGEIETFANLFKESYNKIQYEI